MWQSTNRLGQMTQTSFDMLNRPVQINYVTDAATEGIVYDIFGNKQTAANTTVIYTLSYDAKNRLTGKLDSRNNKSLAFTYDKVGNILTKTDYQNEITRYTYDSANQRVAMKNPAYLAASYQHDNAGRLLSRILSGGAQTHYTWNAGQLTGLKTVTADGTTLNNISYTRDRVGNVLTQADNNGTTTYTYDALYRLSSADYPGTANDESFTYDAVGNRQLHTLNGQTRAYELWANSNRIKAIHTINLAGPVEKSFTYDDEGRLTSQSGAGAKTLAWDQKGRAKQIAAGATNNFSYDPMNYRIAQSGGSLGNRDYYLEGEHLEAEYSGASLKAKYFRGLSTDELVAGYSFDASNQWRPAIYHHDALMSVTGISAHDGAPIQTQSYSAFGDSAIATTGTSNNRLTYTGREKDADTGLYYYRARYYDPSVGAFVSEDPLGFGAGINFYTYVNNNPVNANDPSGLDPYTAIGNAIVKYGGRLGSKETREHVLQVADEWVAKGWELMSGGIKKAEELIRGPGGGAKGGAYGDIVLQNPQTGSELIINTVTTRADGITPIARETAAGVKIQNLRPDSEFLMIPKPKAGATAAGVAAGVGAGSAQASDGGILGVTWGDVGNFLMDMLIPGGIDSVGKGSDIVPGSTSFTGSPQSSLGGSAAGGFLLYPNKPNTNMMWSVYSK